MKLLLLALPLALIACVKPDCVVYVNGKPVYNQCYQDDGKDGGKNYSPPAADDNGGDSNNHGSDSNGNKSKDHSDDSNGGNSDEDDKE